MAGNRNKVCSNILVIMNNHSRLGEGLSSTFKANNNNKSSVTPSSTQHRNLCSTFCPSRLPATDNDDDDDDDMEYLI